MNCHRPLLIALPLTVALSCLLLAGDRPGDKQATLKKSVGQIAAALRKGDDKTAQKLAETVAKGQEKGDVYYLQLLFKPRDKEGFGVGEEQVKIIPDGIELKLRALTRFGIKEDRLKAETDALTQMAYHTAAIARVCGEVAKEGQNGASMQQLYKDMETKAVGLAAEVKKGDPADVKWAAITLERTCENCHRGNRAGALAPPPPIPRPAKK